MMNKKGLGEIASLFLIIGIIIFVLVMILGLGTGIKIFSVIKSIPTWGWIVIGVIFLLLILPKRSKK